MGGCFIESAPEGVSYFSFNFLETSTTDGTEFVFLEVVTSRRRTCLSGLLASFITFSLHLILVITICVEVAQHILFLGLH